MLLLLCSYRWWWIGMMALVFFRMSLLLLKLLLLLLMLMLLLTNTSAQHRVNLLFTVLLLRRLGLSIQLFVIGQREAVAGSSRCDLSWPLWTWIWRLRRSARMVAFIT